MLLYRAKKGNILTYALQVVQVLLVEIADLQNLLFVVYELGDAVFALGLGVTGDSLGLAC